MMAVNPAISSLVICTKDRPSALSDCLESLVALDDCPHEVLIIDASHDRQSEGIVNRIADQHAFQLRWYASPPGLTRQRNLGVSLASNQSEVIHFVDDDTVIRPGYFTELNSVLLNSERAVGAGGRITNLPSYRSPWFLSRRAEREGRVSRAGVNHMSRTPVSIRGRSVDWVSGCSMCFRRSLFEHITFDERRVGNGVGEDVDFCLRALRYGQLLWCSRAEIEHRQSPVNRFSARVSGFEAMNHRLMLADDHLHGVSRGRVLGVGLGEGMGRVLKSAILRSRAEFAYGVGTLQRVLRGRHD